MASKRYKNSPFKKSRPDLILEICILLAEKLRLKVIMGESAKGAGIIGAASFVGGLLGGKTGMIAGSALGTAASYLLLEDFQSVATIIQEMAKDKKNDLVKRIESTLKDVDFKDASTGLTYIIQHGSVMNKVQNQIKTFFDESMELNIAASSPTFESSSFF